MTKPKSMTEQSTELHQEYLGPKIKVKKYTVQRPVTIKHWASAIVSPKEIKPIFKAGAVTAEEPSVESIKKAIKTIMKGIKPEPNRKLKDPLAGLKRKHPTPWSASLYCDWWEVKDKHNVRICFTKSRALARAIARMGNEK